jgi:hypothetical protein
VDASEVRWITYFRKRFYQCEFLCHISAYENDKCKMHICLVHPLETISKSYTVKIPNQSSPKDGVAKSFTKVAQFELPVPLGHKSTQSEVPAASISKGVGEMRQLARFATLAADSDVCVHNECLAVQQQLEIKQGE